jgi:hypothetical protein
MLLMHEDSDGRVAVSSAMAKDMDDFVILPYGHSDIHHKQETLLLTKKFLTVGKF